MLLYINYTSSDFLHNTISDIFKPLIFSTLFTRTKINTLFLQWVASPPCSTVQAIGFYLAEAFVSENGVHKNTAW